MERFYNSLEKIEEYKFSFGKYRNKSLNDILENEDCIEYLKWYRKKIKKEIKNPKAKKFETYNKRGLTEIEDYLISINVNIERTDFDKQNEELKEDIHIEVEESINYENLSFKELLDLMEEKIIEKYDEKFQNKKFIRTEYKDYLCLRHCNLTYLELLEKNQKNDVIKIIMDL